MATTHARIPCPCCRLDKAPRLLGLRPDGSFDPHANWYVEQRLYTFAGRGRITVAHEDVPIQIALGLRDMLRARIAQLDEALAVAGIEVDDVRQAG